ncbi:MAG: SAM-dependent methyltransferase [Zoogloeaceae bacterium]|jgi:SAM-dependent MidA family methyltransferase|nr:SAM-dependent methyltransferase [Zoogloeaceae bacterium]
MTTPIQPDAEALARSERLFAHLAQKIEAAGGWISFADYMRGALYTPELGYYTGASAKFGAGGDFITAPEISPFFGCAVARQLAEIMAQSAPFIVEAGAGSGRLCADILTTLAAADALPERYQILEVSPDLQARQRANLAQWIPSFADRIEWLSDWPENYAGAVIGNEVLDAFAVHLIVKKAGQILEKGVALENAKFVWKNRPATGKILEKSQALDLPDDYETEIAQEAPAWIKAWGAHLQRGGILLIDYGYNRTTFYAPGRYQGTWQCHYRHVAHDDPFLYPGLADLTAHVEFTAIAEAAMEAGMEVNGYASQMRFLLNCGLLNDLEGMDSLSPEYIKVVGGIQKLISPQEMGESFKAIVLGKGLKEPLLGFARGDQRHAL